MNKLECNIQDKLDKMDEDRDKAREEFYRELNEINRTLGRIEGAINGKIIPRDVSP